MERLRSLGIRTITTPMLVSEVDRALGWMQVRLSGVRDGEERERLMRVTQLPGYSENPFVDGFIEGHVAGEWRSMSEFMETIGYEEGIGLRSAIESQGVEIVDPRAFDDQGDQSQIDILGDEIFSERQRKGTVRAGEVQATAEAESLYVLRCIRQRGFQGDASVNNAYFVSTSRLLDILYRKTDGLITWFPETLNNHLTYLSGDAIDADSVFHAITTSFYSAGISVVDEESYRQYFKPAISEANATLQREIDGYVKAVAKSVQEQQHERQSILTKFSRIPDIEKPLFVEQMGWVVARKNEQKARLAEHARDEADYRRKTEVSALKEEYERKERERKRHEAGLIKNLADPKHQRKLRNQAKKRKRKKR